VSFNTGLTGVSQRCFSVHFRQVFFNTIALPRINIGADVWGESSIMKGVYQRWYMDVSFWSDFEKNIEALTSSKRVTWSDKIEAVSHFEISPEETPLRAPSPLGVRRLSD